MNAKNIRYNNRWKKEAIKNRILLQFSTICYIIDVSNKMNKNLSVISLELFEIFTFLLRNKFGYGDKIIQMVKDVYINIQSKIKIHGLLSDPFNLMQEICQGWLLYVLLYIIAAEVLASFINANEKIKGIQIGHHEIKIVNFADDTTIFLRDITCLDRIQVILKLYEDASSSKVNFSKSQSFAKFSLKDLKLTLVTLF